MGRLLRVYSKQLFEICNYLYNWVLNEADMFKSSSILIYYVKEQSIYTQEVRHDVVLIKMGLIIRCKFKLKYNEIQEAWQINYKF